LNNGIVGFIAILKKNRKKLMGISLLVRFKLIVIINLDYRIV